MSELSEPRVSVPGVLVHHGLLVGEGHTLSLDPREREAVADLRGLPTWERAVGRWGVDGVGDLVQRGLLLVVTTSSVLRFGVHVEPHGRRPVFEGAVLRAGSVQVPVGDAFLGAWARSGRGALRLGHGIGKAGQDRADRVVHDALAVVAAGFGHFVDLDARARRRGTYERSV